MTVIIQELIKSAETIVLGHRGAMAYAPMNTLKSFEWAQKQGAHGIELDVQLSSDGYPVVIHDHTVDDTTDGTGMVKDKTLAELKELDAGSWFAARFAGERIPTLDQVFQFVASDMLINVEIKSDGLESTGIEEAVVNCIQRHQVLDRVIISSFGPHRLHKVRKLLPDALIGVLTIPALPPEYQESIDQLRHQARHPWHEEIDETYMRWARDNQYYVIAWTVNEPTRALQLKALGVNAVITDCPDRILAAFAA